MNELEFLDDRLCVRTTPILHYTAVRDYLDGATTMEVLSNYQISDGSVL